MSTAPGKNWDRLVGAARPYRAAIAVIAIAIAMTSVFALSYSLALGRPAAHDVPIGIVGGGAEIASLQRATHSKFQIVIYRNEAAARRAIDVEQVYGVLLPHHPQQLLEVAPL